jgi:hypothetical protein
MNYLVVTIGIVIAIAIVVVVGYFYFPTPKVLKEPVVVYIYEKQEENLWDGSASKEYTCQNAKNVNLKGDYANYCIFDTEKDVNEWCNNDSECIGYVKKDGQDENYSAVKKTTPNSAFNNTLFFYKKTSLL